MELQLEDPEK